MPKIDLHTHSDFSDGTCVPEEVVRAALKAGVSYMLPLIFNIDAGFAGSDTGMQTVLWIQIAVNALLTAVLWWWGWRLAKKSVNIE